MSVGLVARLRAFAARLLGLGSRSQDERAMDAEMAFHLEEATQRHLRRGMAPEEARRLALLDFGGVARQREDARDALRNRWIEDLLRDLRYGLRGLRRHPAFAITAVLTAGLGIAAAVTVFTIVDAIYLRPLPVPDAGRLVHVRLIAPRGHGGTMSLGEAGAALLRGRAGAFDAVVTQSSGVVNVTAKGSSTERFAEFVSPGYFQLFHVAPALGRFFTAGENAVPDRDRVAVIGDDLWRTQLGSDPHVIGSRILVRGRELTVIGVAPPGFVGISVGGMPYQVWLPTMLLGTMGFETCVGQPRCGESDVLARLAPGSSLSQARAQVHALAPALAELAQRTDVTPVDVVQPLRGMDTGERRQYQGFAWILSGIAALLAIIACANLAGLLVTRGSTRTGEIALRFSLGAGRGRLVRQLLAENLAVGVAGGVLGVALSVASTRTLMGFFATDSEGFPHYFYLGLHPLILGFAVAATAGAVLLFGLLPALTTSRAALAGTVRGAAIGRARGRLVLNGLQVALSVTLLGAAGLLVRSARGLVTAQHFDAAHVALVRLRPQMIGYDSSRAQAYLRLVLARLSENRDVVDVAFARGRGFVWETGAEDRPLGRTVSDTQLVANVHPVSPGFFVAMRIPLVSGRDFTPGDNGASQRVVVLTRRLAAKLFPHEVALDREVFIGGQPLRVVGIAEDYVPHAIAEAAPMVALVPFWQNVLGPETDARLAVRVRGDPVAALPGLRRTISAVDPAVPVTELMSMQDQVNEQFAPVRLGAAVTMGAALAALFLTGIGLYGVIAFSVQRRTREFGVRIAMGATGSQLVGIVLRQCLGVALAGALAGAVLGLALSRLLNGFLVGVEPRDGVTMLAAVGSAVLMALLSTLVPARRAARVHPMEALRAD